MWEEKIRKIWADPYGASPKFYDHITDIAI